MRQRQDHLGLRLLHRTTRSLLLDDHFTDLVEARIDVGFRAGSAPQRNVIARRLEDIALQICAAPPCLAAFGAPADAAQLLQHRCTGFRQPDTGRRTPWDLHIDGNTVYQDVPAVASFNTVEAEVAAVLATRERGIDMYDAQRTHLLLRVRNFIDFVVAAKTRAALA